jgi:hypothetical protein
MRTVFSVFLGLVFLAILGGIGVSIYNAGVSAGLAQTGTVVAGAGPYLYGWGFHGGFGFLGLLFPLFFLFLIFVLLRAAIGGGRRGWGHGWHDGERMDGWRADRERYLADMHRRFHEADGQAGGGSQGGGSGSGSSTDPGR